MTQYKIINDDENIHEDIFPKRFREIAKKNSEKLFDVFYDMASEDELEGVRSDYVASVLSSILVKFNLMVIDCMHENLKKYVDKNFIKNLMDTIKNEAITNLDIDKMH